MYLDGDIVPIKQQESVKHDIHSTFDLPKPVSRPIKRKLLALQQLMIKEKKYCCQC